MKTIKVITAICILLIITLFALDANSQQATINTTRSNIKDRSAIIAGQDSLGVDSTTTKTNTQINSQTTVTPDKIEPPAKNNTTGVDISKTTKQPEPKNNISITPVFPAKGDIIFCAASINTTRSNIKDKSSVFKKESKAIVLPVIFKWTCSAPIGSDTYKVVIVKINDGQNLEDALKSNTKIFEAGNIKSNSLQIPDPGKVFEAGKNYAWKVMIISNGETVGESDYVPFAATINTTRSNIKHKGIN